MADPIQCVVERWAQAFNAHRLDDMQELFTDDASFQGFGPEVVIGGSSIREYYGAVPGYRRAEDVAVLCSYLIGDGVAGGFLKVVFRDPSGWEAPVHLSLVVQREGEQWLIRQYHVSRMSADHN